MFLFFAGSKLNFLVKQNLSIAMKKAVPSKTFEGLLYRTFSRKVCSRQ